MIKSDHQYRVTREWYERFRDSAAEQKKRMKKNPGMTDRIMLADTRYMRDRLLREMKEYNDLKKSKPVLGPATMDDAGFMLIRARIASHITEEEMARRLEIPAKQYMLYEKDDMQEMPLCQCQSMYDILAGRRGPEDGDSPV